jgi:hypothetical protein
MKFPLSLLALALGLFTTACQHQAPPAQAVARVAPAPAKAIGQKSASEPGAAAPADTLTPEMVTMLREYDLSELFRDLKLGSSSLTTIDGFAGKSPERVSLAILKMSRDSLRPNTFHVAGKTRYRKSVTNFEGSMQVRHLSDFYDQGILMTVMDSLSDTLTSHAYTAYAQFNFKSKNSPAAYKLSGRALLDFWVSSTGKLEFLHSPCAGCIDKLAPARGSGLLLQGSWLDVASGSSKALLISTDVFLISPDLISDFGIGDRGSQVNPKYAKSGWTEYWENEEWWADSPKPSLNL